MFRSTSRSPEPRQDERFIPVLGYTAFLLLTLATALLAGCSAATGPRQESTGSPSIWQQSHDVDAAEGSRTSSTLLERYGPSPLAAYTVGEDDALAIAEAEDVILRQCMSDKGFDYLPPPPDIGTIGGVDWNDWDDFLGVTEKQNAESLGYRMVPDGAFGSIPTTGPDDQFDPSVEVALWGDQAVGEDGLPLAGAKKGDKGCQGEVEARLVPLVDSSLNLDIRGESLKRAKAKAQSSNQVQTALAAWKDCMHDAGYNLNEIPLIGMAEGMDADDMKRQAVVDVGCKDSSGLTDAYITNLYEAEDAEIDAHRAEFDAEEAHYQQRLQMVRDVLAGKEK